MEEERQQKVTAQTELAELRSRVSGLEAEIGKSHATVESYQRQVQDTEVSLRDGGH